MLQFCLIGKWSGLTYLSWTSRASAAYSLQTADRWLPGARRGRMTEPVGFTRSLQKYRRPRSRGGAAKDRDRPVVRERGLAHSSPNANIIAEFFGDDEVFVGDVCGS